VPPKIKKEKTNKFELTLKEKKEKVIQNLERNLTKNIDKFKKIFTTSPTKLYNINKSKLPIVPPNSTNNENANQITYNNTYNNTNTEGNIINSNKLKDKKITSL
jgi:hypothetical protein